MTSDSELLRRYAESSDESAFTEVVRRHLSLVYASAVRLLNGDAALAQDVTQAVFSDLAYKAASLAGHTTVAGWLHTSVRYAASKAVRSEERRRNHEQEASTMNDHPTTDIAWMQLRPLLDDAVGELSDDERNAVLLRFFELKSHREVGDALGLNENAARMRVDRAVEKLREYFTRHGVTTTAAMLTSTLSVRAASVAPLQSFVSSVATNSMANVAILNAMTVTATTSLLQKALMAIGGALVVATVTVLIYSQFSLPSLAPQNSPAPAVNAQPPAVGAATASSNVNSSIISSASGTSAPSSRSALTVNEPDASILVLPDAKLTEPLANAERHVFVLAGIGTVQATITNFQHGPGPLGTPIEIVILHEWSKMSSTGDVVPTNPNNDDRTKFTISRFNGQDQQYIKNWVLKHATADKTPE